MLILVVDDVAANRKLLRVTLESEGFEVIEAEDGQQALNLLAQTKVDAVISDILMPTMDGFHFCAELRKIPEYTLLPFFFYTGTYTAASDEQMALRLGATKFFKKPSSIKLISNALREAIETPQPEAHITQELPPETKVMKQYNELLIRRLEKKNAELENAKETLLAAKNELEATTEQLKYLVENLDGVFFSFDVKDQKMLFVSAGCEVLYGIPKDEFIANPSLWLHATHEEDRSIPLSMNEQLELGNAARSEFRIVRPGGDIRWVEARLKPGMGTNGELEHIFGIITDITERIKAEKSKEELEQQFLQAQKMEAIGQLAGGVAHDFNNSIMAILGYAELIKLTKADMNKVEQHASAIARVAAQAGNITAQLLAFSRKQILSPRKINLNDTIQKMEGFIRRLIGEDFQLITKLAPDLGTVLVDPVKMEQVLMNLAVNARDAMPKGGGLTIATENLKLDSAYKERHAEVEAGDYVLMSVSDTGTGIDDDIVPRIFEPFFTTKAEGKGTGLGLSTVYGIVKQSEGHILVYSQLNQGTTFKLLFPRIRTGDAILAELESKTEDLHGLGEGILLVDDNEALRISIGSLLESKGYIIHQAGSPQEALEIASSEAHKIDMLITDVVMPHMSGIELAASLQEILPGIKVLFMSGYSEDAILLQGILNEESAFISKPSSVSNLLKRIRDLLAQ